MSTFSENILQYVLDTFKSSFYNCDAIEIDFGTNNDAPITIVNASSDFFQCKNMLDDTKIVWKNVCNQKIPFLFSASDVEELFTITETKIIINYDIISSAFYFLSCWQEYVSESKDSFDRYQYESSLQKKLNIATIPVVNYYFNILQQAIEHAYKIKLIPKTPLGNAPFTVCLTHDIDACFSGWKQDVFWALKHAKLGSILKIITNKIHGKDTWFNFDTIIKSEKKHQATSSFYFLTKNKGKSRIINSDYDLTSDKLKKVFKTIERADSEIGIHGSYRTHDDVEAFRKDIAKINMDIIGNRFHYLEFDIEKSPTVLQANDIKYDTTLGFAESIGFRSAYCLPYYLWDFNKACRSEVLEIPLMIMDTTLRSYCKLNPEEVFEHIQALIAEVEKFSGVLTLLWHNTSFSEYKYKGWGKMYSDLLRHFSNKGAWLTKASEVYFLYK